MIVIRRTRDGHDDRSERGAWGRDRSSEDRTEQPWVRMGEGASEGRAERPRLNLKPRTAAPASEPAPAKDKPNPFGKAKPVDVRASPEGGERKAASPAPKVFKLVNTI